MYRGTLTPTHTYKGGDVAALTGNNPDNGKRLFFFLFCVMRMEMKMGAVSAISLLLLCSSGFSSADSKDLCDLYAATGSDFTVPMVSVMNQSYSLKWSHNDITIFYRKKDKVLTEHSVSENGSLKLTNVKENNKGSYKSDLYDSEGANQGSKVQRLCVIDPPPKPEVKFKCKENDKQLECTCFVSAKPADGLQFVWLQNNVVLEKETRQTLKKPVEQVKTSPISCKVSNLASSMTSEPVTHNCTGNSKDPTFIFPDKLWGINTWIFVGAGGGLVLILIILVIISCIRTRRRKRMRLKEEGELRLAWTNDKQHHSHPPDHHHHHPHHPQQQPAGHTGPRQQRSRQQRPRGPDHPKARPQPSPRRAAQAQRPPGQIDEEQPPPLPQPRKNATKTQRV